MTVQDIPNVAFRQLAASLSEDIVPSSNRSFELCLREDALPVRILLHPDLEHVVMQAYAADLSMVLGPARGAVFAPLLLINQAALRGRPFNVSVDTRDFVCLTAKQRLDKASGDDFLEDLDYLLQQASEVRKMVMNITMQGAEMDYEPVAAETEEEEPQPA